MKLEGVIYCGDNLHWMLRMPDEFVDLCYIDPPFFSQKRYEVVFRDGEEIRSFEDRWKGGIENYIGWMRDRVEQIHRLLKPTGSFYLHCDWHASHYLKVMCDQIFGENNFRDEIIWSYTKVGGTKKKLLKWHETILRYSKTEKFTFNIDELREPYSPTLLRQAKQDERGLYYMRGLGRDPYVKRLKKTYLHPKGRLPGDVWNLALYAPPRGESLGYPTQKPEGLLERIIKLSSNPGDLVFDCFCACGTTPAVACRLGRRWLGIDVSPTGCKLVQYRLSKLGVKAEIIGLPRTLGELKGLSGIEFQNWVIGVMGGKPADRKSRDMGIDGYTFYGLWGEKQYPVQVKKMERVGRPVVDAFETAMERKGATKGYIVAFSFSKDAYEEVARAKTKGFEIELVKVEELREKFLEGRPA